MELGGVMTLAHNTFVMVFDYLFDGGKRGYQAKSPMGIHYP